MKNVFLAAVFIALSIIVCPLLAGVTNSYAFAVASFVFGVIGGSFLALVILDRFVS